MITSCMKRIPPWLWVCGMFLLIPAHGQNMPASSGNTANEIVEKYHGVRFRVPESWIARRTEAGYVFGSQTEKGIMLMVPHEMNSLDEIRQEAQKGIIDEGTALHLAGTIVPFGKTGLAGQYRGTMQGRQATAYAIGLLAPQGGGVTILIAVEPASYTSNYQQIAETLARSVHFFQPEVPPVAVEWKQRLNDCRLTYMWSYYSGGNVDGSYAGGSRQSKIDLCSRGYFRYSDNSSMSVDGGYGGGYNASGYISEFGMRSAVCGIWNDELYEPGGEICECFIVIKFQTSNLKSQIISNF